MKGITRLKFNSHDPRKTNSAPKQQTGFELTKLGGKSKITKPISCHWSLSIPPENIRKPDVFLIFSGCIVREEWVNKNLRTQRLFHPSTSFLSLHFWLYGFLQLTQFCKFLAFKSVKKFSFLISPEAAFQRCCVKKVFSKISQNLQENTRARVSFLIKVQL